MRSHTAVDPARQPTVAHLSLAPVHHRSDVRSVPQFVDHLLHSRRGGVCAKEQIREAAAETKKCDRLSNVLERGGKTAARFYVPSNKKRAPASITAASSLVYSTSDSRPAYEETTSSATRSSIATRGETDAGKKAPKKTHRQLPPSPNCLLHCTWGCSMRKPTAIPLG